MKRKVQVEVEADPAWEMVLSSEGDADGANRTLGDRNWDG